MLRHARLRAKRDGLPFSLTLDDISIPPVCPVFRTPLSKGTRHSGPSSPTLDRIYPDRGYVPGNVIVISDAANRKKSSATPEELVVLAKFYKRFIK